MNLLRILIILLLVEIITVGSSYADDDLQWAEAVSSTLHIGDTINVGDYTVKASQFHKPMIGVRDINGDIVPRDDFEPSVDLELFKNGTLLDSFLLTRSDNSIVTDDEEIKVTLQDIVSKENKVWVYEYYDPWAKIGVQSRGLPKLEISINTTENTYTSHRDTGIALEVKIKNTGEGDAKNVYISILTDSLAVKYGESDDPDTHYSEIRAGEEKIVELDLIIPDTLLETKKYILSAAAGGYDRKGLYYEGFGYKVIAIIPPADFILDKYVKDRIYLSETATVYLKITNIGVFDVLNISIRDSISDNFVLISDSSLYWEIPVLPPGESKVVGSYELEPREANRNGFLLPSSVAYYTIKDRIFFIESQMPKVIVNGPQILLEKSVSDAGSAGNDIEVSLTAYNVGNAPTKVSITDQMPEGALLIKGFTSLPQTFLDSSGSLSTSYVMRIFSEGNYTLPQAEAEYYDISNTRDNIDRKVYSNQVNITVGRPYQEQQSSAMQTKTTLPVFVTRTPVATISPDNVKKEIPGFGVSLFMLNLFIIYILSKYKK